MTITGVLLFIINIIIAYYFIVFNYYRYKKLNCSGNTVIDFEKEKCLSCPKTTWRYGTGDETSMTGCYCLNNKLEYVDGNCKCKSGYEEFTKSVVNADGSTEAFNDCRISCVNNSNRINDGSITNSLECKCNTLQEYDTISQQCINRGEIKKIYFKIIKNQLGHTYASKIGYSLSNMNFLYINDIVKLNPLYESPIKTYDTGPIRDVSIHFGEDVYIYSIINEYVNRYTVDFSYTVPEFTGRVVKNNELLSIFNTQSLKGIDVEHDRSIIELDYLRYNRSIINCNFPYKSNIGKKYLFVKFANYEYITTNIIDDHINTCVCNLNTPNSYISINICINN